MTRPDSGGVPFWTVLGVGVAVRAAVTWASCCVTAALVWQFGHGDSNLVEIVGGVVLVASTVVGVGLAGWSALRAVRATVAFERQVRRTAVALPSSAWMLAREVGLAERVAMVVSPELFAVTYGLVRPRVLVSSGLVDTLEAEELRAVLAHEAEHVRGRDPARTVLLRWVSARQFYLPLLGHLRERFTTARELAADRRARAASGTAAVAGALLKVTEGPSWAAAAPAAAMGVPGLLHVRVAQLEDQSGPLPPPARWRVALTVAGAGVLAWALIGSLLLIAHTPLPCMA